MATEVLSIPEEYLSDVIRVIRVGLDMTPGVDPEVRKRLSEWCEQEAEYLGEEE